MSHLDKALFHMKWTLILFALSYASLLLTWILHVRSLQSRRPLNILISEALSYRPGHEFMLIYLGSSRWRAGIVNPSTTEPLGQVWPEYCVDESSAEAAVLELIAMLEQDKELELKGD